MDSIKLKETETIPLTPKARINEISKLSNAHKAQFLPPGGAKIQLGPYIYEVSIVNAGQMRFSAKLYDVVIEGLNDETRS